MRKNRLPKREIEICERLKLARERVGYTQEACAALVGIERSTLSNYEYGKTPLRFDVALKFCRHLIVSEEWLATGKFAAMREAGIALGWDPQGDWNSLEPIFLRQCMDLAAEREYHDIPPSTLFSAAFDDYLSVAYSRLAKQFYHWPRIVLSQANEPELGISLLRAHMERWLILVEAHAAKAGRDAWECQRQLIRAIFSAGTTAFTFYASTDLDDAGLQKITAKFDVEAKGKALSKIGVSLARTRESRGDR